VKITKNKKIITAVSLLFVLIFIFSLSQTKILEINAQAPAQELSGYAWSDTIGWISFATSTNGNNKVTVDSNGNLNGFAWSDNIGWIKFGGLASTAGFTAFPSGSGTDAKLSGLNLSGWARACAGTKNGDCSTMENKTSTWAENGDSGVTWTARESNRFWQSITSSSDGTRLAAVVNGGQIYTSTDSGVTWTARESNRFWQSITSSSDGTRLAAVVTGGQIYTSTNSGVNWTARDSNLGWESITSSADGTRLAAVVWGGQIYTSTDSGVTWTARESNRSWQSITSSADGTRLAVVLNIGQIYTSTPELISVTSNDWDGWISLSGTGYGVKLDGTTPSFAWGSDILGWIDFSRVTLSSVSPVNVLGCPTYNNTFLPNLPAQGYLCVNGSIESLQETQILGTATTTADLYDYKYDWNCTNGTNNLSCSVTTALKNSPNNSYLLDARLVPNIVNSQSEFCTIQWTTPANYSCVINRSGNPYSDSDLVEGYQINAGSNYTVRCTEVTPVSGIIYESKNLTCLLNPKVKEI